MVKKCVAFILPLFIIIGNIFSLSEGESYSYKEEWYIGTEVGGEDIVQLIISKIHPNRIDIKILKTMTGFPEFVVIEEIAFYNNGKYIFQFIDGWGNRGDGYFVVEDEHIKLFIQCTKVANNLSARNMSGRIYGDGLEYTLIKGSL